MVITKTLWLKKLKEKLLVYSSIGRVHSGRQGMAADGQNMKLADHVLSTHRKQREEEVGVRL